MFCTNCGKELNEQAQFCPYCGVKAGESKANIKINILTKKNIIAIVAVVLVVAVGVLCIGANGVNSSPEKVAAATVKSEYEADIKTMMKCFPNFTIKEIAVDEGLSMDASVSQVIKKVEEDYRYTTPQEVEIIKTELVGEYDISEYTIYRELHDYMTDKDYDLISSVAVVNVYFTVDGEEENEQLTCIKMKNKWYFLRNI